MLKQFQEKVEYLNISEKYLSALWVMGWADGRLAWGCCRPSQAFTTPSLSSASLSSSSALLSSSSELLLSSSLLSLKVCVSCSQHHEHHPHQNFSSCLVVAPGSLTLFLPHCNVHSKCALKMCTDSHTALLQGTHSHTTVLLAAPFKTFPPETRSR